MRVTTTEPKQKSMKAKSMETMMPKSYGMTGKGKSGMNIKSNNQCKKCGTMDARDTSPSMKY